MTRPDVRIYDRARDVLLALPKSVQLAPVDAMRELADPRYVDERGYHRDSVALAGLPDVRCLFRAVCRIVYRKADTIRVLRIEPQTG